MGSGGSGEKSEMFGVTAYMLRVAYLDEFGSGTSIFSFFQIPDESLNVEIFALCKDCGAGVLECRAERDAQGFMVQCCLFD